MQVEPGSDMHIGSKFYFRLGPNALFSAKNILPTRLHFWVSAKRLLRPHRQTEPLAKKVLQACPMTSIPAIKSFKDGWQFTGKIK